MTTLTQIGAVRWAGGVAAAAAAWAVLAATLPHGAPAGIILAGAVFGGINALIAISIVLVYRANRVANFAAAEFGSVAAVVAIELHIQVHVNYFVSVAAGLVLSAVLGAVTEVTILRRFSKAPRLIMAVATIGLAQLLNGLSVIIPTEWSSHGSGGTFSTPFGFHFMLFPVLFNGNYVVAMILVPVVLILLAWFLRATSYGVAIRASADNGDRARLMGVPVARLSTIVWSITAVLSALAVLLRVPILGFTSFSSVSGGGVDLLLLTFTAAVLAGMTSIPVALAASIGLGVAEQLGAWTFQNSTFVDAMLLAVILVALLLRRERLTRAAETGISTWQAVRPVRAVPTELASLWEVRLGRSAVRLGVLALGLALPFWLAPARTQLASLVLIYAIVAVSLVVLTGWAGHVSLGQIALMGFGGAVTCDLFAVHGWDLFFALAAASAVSGLLALVIGIPALRVSSLYLGVVTLAFAVTSYNYFLVPRYFKWLDPTVPLSRPALFGRISIGSDREMYFFCLVVLVLVLVAARTLRASHAGRAIIAARENRLASEAAGLSTVRLNLVAFAVSGVLAGLAGGLFVVQQQGFNFSAFDPYTGILFFTMVVIGGLGSIPGAVLGAIYVYGAQYLLQPGYQFLATGAGLLVLLMFLPGGLGELVFRARDVLLRLAANRRGLLVPSLVADRLVDADPEMTTLIDGGLMDGDLTDGDLAGPAEEPVGIDSEPQTPASRPRRVRA
jgi:branched-chain amino acid transport system permease protein